MEEEIMVEEREEVMVSLTGSDPTRRQAFFLKPSVSETVSGTLSPSLSFPYPAFDPQNWPLKISFRGWRYPGHYWAKWVDLLLPQYKSVWEKVGIFDAILSTTHEIRKDYDLVCGVVERWCPETKSFVFVWGEATITLEDVMVLGGYSVIGEHVALPLVTTELKEIEERLVVAKNELCKGKFRHAPQNDWLKKFMGSGSDIEHEAFLVFWLSKFIFPNSNNLIRSSIFTIAIHLARGKRIALAPAVLASIYRDLTLLKQAIVDSAVLDRGEDGDDALHRTLWSPFQLVQLWAWERFPEVQPVPNSLKEDDTRSARWDRVKRVTVGNVRSVLDSSGESFLWRPYTNAMHEWKFRKFYKECNGWIHDESGSHEEFLSFARCIRVSQLVGLGVVQQYLPHRVAMQFGMDQDLPANIRQPDATSEIAWSNYCKPVGNKLYIPSRLFESDVTVGYLEWWKHSMLKLQMLPQVEATVNVKKPRRERRARTGSHMNKEDSGGSDSSSTSSNAPRRYKFLEEVVQSVASVQVMKDAAVSSSPDGGVNTMSARSVSEEVSGDTAIMKKPKLELEEKTGEIDKVIAPHKAEMVNRFGKQVKMLRPAEIEKMIAALKEEFGVHF